MMIINVVIPNKCKYNCAYCIERTSIFKPDYDKLNKELIHFEHYIESFHIFGGCPLEYSGIEDVLQVLKPICSNMRTSDYGFGIRNNIDLIKKYRLNVQLSHDFNTQYLRGKDPLISELEYWDELYYDNLFTMINVCVTKDNDYEAAIEYFNSMWPGIHVKLNGYVGNDDNMKGPFGSFDELSVLNCDERSCTIRTDGRWQYCKLGLDKCPLAVSR